MSQLSQTTTETQPGSAPDAWDPLHRPGSPDMHWSTDNVGEAMPGVMTPLGWTVWAPAADQMPRDVAYALGVFTRAEHRPPASDEERITTVFYGRAAMAMEYLAKVGDRMPGTSGEEVVNSLFGHVPEGMEFASTARRYPIIAARLPWVFTTTPGRIRRLAVKTDAWWREQAGGFEALDLEGARRLFAEANKRFDHTITVHSIGLLGVVQPMHDALEKLVKRTGVGDVGSLSGSGGAEMAIVEDIWKAAQGQIDLEEVVSRHGFHGPGEGELSSRVWREDDAPLRRLLADYAEQPDPAIRDEEARRRRPELQRELIAALPVRERPAARLVLRLAAARIPLRGVGKRSFLQTLDVARGAARAAGAALAADGRLDDPEDVFYLTAGELTGTLPADAKELVARRRQRRAEYQRLELPGSWRGSPTPKVADEAQAEDSGGVSGIGVSDGVVEGTVRVVTDPGFAEVEPGEVLVSPTTDPSWASIMFVSAALVVDIGGPLSHAAVVARELGIPCVVNTRNGSRALRTGDRVRVDGSKGTVEVLS